MSTPTFNPPPQPPAASGPPPPQPPAVPTRHPVQVEIERAPEQSRVLAGLSIPWFLARAVLLIPAMIVVYFVMIAAYVVAWIGQWAILFTGRYPAGMHDFVHGALRWQTRIAAYLLGLTDSYPPFRLSA